MQEYCKIQSIYKRDPDTKYKTFLEGQFSLPELEYLANNVWWAEEKIDGTNIRIHYKPIDYCDYNEPQVRFGGRTDKAQIPTFLLDRLQNLFTPDMLAPVFDCPVTLYGEGFGARIQKGGGNYIPDGVDFILFDVMIENMWLERHNVRDIADNLGIMATLDWGNMTLYEAINDCKQGFNSVFGQFEAEGLVLRPHTELLTRRGHRIITKVKCKDFRYE